MARVDAREKQERMLTEIEGPSRSERDAMEGKGGEGPGAVDNESVVSSSPIRAVMCVCVSV